MRKTMIMFLAIITACAFIASCGSQPNNTSNNGKDDKSTRATLPSSGGGVTMTITPDSFNPVPETIKMTIVNNSDTVAEYGAYYTIEEYQNKNWVRLPFNDELAFIDILYVQQAGETREYDISLYPNMANYKKGNYRIRRSINLGDRKLDLAAEFTVK